MKLVRFYEYKKTEESFDEELIPLFEEKGPVYINPVHIRTMKKVRGFRLDSNQNMEKIELTAIVLTGLLPIVVVGTMELVAAEVNEALGSGGR